MINVAIIGTGAICGAHMKAYVQLHSRCNIIALADIYPEKAKERADEFQLNDVFISDDYHDLLALEDVDLVSVCTPPYTHAPIAIDCLEKGKHVLVEKPMASSLEECNQMITAAKKAGKKLSVIAQNRFQDPIWKLKKVIDQDMIGDIVHVQVDSFWWRGYSYYDLWWRGTWEKEGGGCTLNHAVHHIDAFQWMIEQPTEVRAVMSNTAHDNAEVEDISIAILRLAGGALAQITSSVVHHGEEKQIIFQGKKARVSVPWRLQASESEQNGFPAPNPGLEESIQSYYETIPELAYTGHAGQIDDVLSAIENDQPVLIDGEEGRRTLELITAIYKSAATDQNVSLPLSTDDPFYTREGILANAIYFNEKKNSVQNFDNNTITLGDEYGGESN